MACRLGAKAFRILTRNISNTTNVPTSVLEIQFAKPVGSHKTIKGWVKSVRKMGKTIFLDINDGSCIDSLQVVVPKEKLSTSIQWGSSVNIMGEIQANPKGQLELRAEEVNLIGVCDVTDDYPFTPKQKQSYDYYRQYLHLRPKIQYFTTMMRFRSSAFHKIIDYFHKNGFTQIHTPVITSCDCEGGGESFLVKPESQELIQAMKKENDSNENAFFNSPAYLTVSGQLHLEAVTRSIAKVYTFNPSFRAENSKSRLHLSEFYMVEAEEAFITDLQSVLSRIESLIKNTVSYLIEKDIKDIEFMLHHNETNSKEHLKVLEDLISKPFSVLTFSEAKSIITNNENKLIKSNISPYNLTKEEELFLVEYNSNTPIFVVDWPKNEKPFYMKESSQSPDLVHAVDLLVPNVGELCGGSLREDNYDVLQKKLQSMHSSKDLEWYLELRKFGNVPTGGFGLGFERFIQFVLNIQNIKDTIPFPRWPHGLQL